MPIIATAGDSKTYAPAPAGVHQAVCVDVVDMGLLEVTFNGKTKTQHKVRIAWQIDEIDPERAERFLVQKRYTLSLHEKANLRKDLESWRGKAFSDDDLSKGFDIEKLIGVNAFMNVVHVIKGDKTYANVAAIMPLKKGAAKIEPQKYIRFKDRKPDDGHGPVPDSELPELTDDDIPF
jgi:hypothetical protein